jgi:hypothetical protein
MLPIQAWFYPEFPYTQEFSMVISKLAPLKYQATAVPVSEQGLSSWQESAGAYTSQISTFWSSVDEMRVDIARHSEQFDGVTLWHPPGDDHLLTAYAPK